LSLKENIEMVKEELNSEEKFFESAVKAERLWGKYKTVIIAGVAGIITVVVISAVNDAKKESEALEASKILATLQAEPSDAAKAELAALNPKLFAAWQYSAAVAANDIAALEALKASDDAIIRDLATYEVAARQSNAAQLQHYASSQKAIYKDLATLESALLLIKNNQTDQAHQKLSLISQDSALYKIAKSLMHYGVK